MRVTREALVDAGARVLAQDRAAPLARVATAASVSRATLHRMFPSRDALLEAIVERACAEAGRIFDAVDLAGGPVERVLAELIDGLVPVAHLWTLAINEPMIDQVPRLAKEAEDLEHRLIELMQRGQREGVLRPDQSPRWMTYLFGMALSAVHQGVAAGFLAPRDAPDLVRSSLLDGIRRTGVSGAG